MFTKSSVTMVSGKINDLFLDSDNFFFNSIIYLFTGTIKFIEFPIDRFHQKLGRGFAYVEYVNAEDAENAMKHMDGGQIDGQEVTVAPILLPKPRPPMPMRRGWRRSPQRFRRGGRSPIRRRNSRRRSRSPVRRRRSNSSDSSR